MSKSDENTENTNFTKENEEIEPSENENTKRVDLEYGDIKVNLCQMDLPLAEGYNLMMTFLRIQKNG